MAATGPPTARHEQDSLRKTPFQASLSSLKLREPSNARTWAHQTSLCHRKTGATEPIQAGPPSR
eukprot:7466356-Pyramimonas_sp.AAC.1